MQVRKTQRKRLPGSLGWSKIGSHHINHKMGKLSNNSFSLNEKAKKIRKMFTNLSLHDNIKKVYRVVEWSLM